MSDCIVEVWDMDVDMADTVSSNCMLFMLLSKVEDSIGIMRVIVFFRCGVEMQMGLI